MKQNRNSVRLTEAQLKQMIAESVKKALNGIDWRGLSQDEGDTFKREANDIHDGYEYDEREAKENLCGNYEFYIRIGKYDEEIFNDEWVEHMISIFKGYPRYADSIYKTIESRRKNLKHRMNLDFVKLFLNPLIEFSKICNTFTI